MTSALTVSIEKARMSLRHLLSFLVFALVGCASKPVYREQGWASYIADQYTGRPTSSGEIYYPQGYTAAHQTLPFGTQVAVKNLNSGRSVNVVINDRFPYYPGRVINLSSAAAQSIGIPYMQLGQVEITIAQMPQQQPTNYGFSQPPPAYNQPAYGSAPSYSQPAYSQPSYSQPSYSQPRSTPSYSTPNYGSGAPNAPAFGNGSSTPAGLQTF